VRADLVLMLFASTALLEALLIDRQILVLVDPRFVKMQPEARRALERRAMVAATPEEFLTRADSLLRSGAFAVSLPLDDSFLRHYGTHLNDGRSAERALAAIVGPIGDQKASNVCLAQA
jgi:hypothetical protein